MLQLINEPGKEREECGWLGATGSVQHPMSHFACHLSQPAHSFNSPWPCSFPSAPNWAPLSLCPPVKCPSQCGHLCFSDFRLSPSPMQHSRFYLPPRPQHTLPDAQEASRHLTYNLHSSCSQPSSDKHLRCLLCTLQFSEFSWEAGRIKAITQMKKSRLSG